MTSRQGIPLVPASYLGIVLGLSGLGGGWRLAHQIWHVPAAIGEVVVLLDVVAWAVLCFFQALKWFAARDAALAEASHPVVGGYTALNGVATMLIAGVVLPYSRAVALVLFGVGLAFTLLFAIWRTGTLWLGERNPADTTPILYLPTVASSFVAGTTAAALGFPDWGQLAFGVGLFSWLAVESVILNRLLTSPGLAKTLRPTLGIHAAPAAVGAVTFLTVAPDGSSLIAHAMIGYAILQALVLLRLLPWIMQERFAPSYWSFTFGITALGAAPLRLLLRGDTGAITVLAPILFAVANVVVLAIAAGTLVLMVRRRLGLTWAQGNWQLG